MGWTPSLATRRRRSRQRFSEAVVCTLTWLLVVVPTWPGIYSIDSQAILSFGREGPISDWYSPTLGWLWGAVDRIGVPAGVIYAASVALFVVVVHALYRLALPARWAVVATPATVLFPPVYGLVAWMGRDVWFTTFLLAALASYAWSRRRPEHRLLLVCLAIASAWAAADARQNGLPVLVLVVVAGGWVALTPPPRPAARVFVSASIAIIAIVSLNVVHDEVVERDLHPEQSLFLQDLTMMSLRVDENLIPPSAFPSGDLSELSTAVDAMGVFAVANEAEVLHWNPYEGPSGSLTRELRMAWAAAIRSHPLAYAYERGAFYLRQLGISEPSPTPWFTRTDELAPFTEDSGLRQSFPELNDVRVSYLRTFSSDGDESGLLHTPALYVVGGVAGSLMLIRGYRRLVSLGWLSLAVQAVLQAGLFAVAPVIEYRFQFPQVALGVVLPVMALSDRARHRRRLYRLASEWRSPASTSGVA